MFRKHKTARDKKYLDFIRSKPCCICGRPAEPHHEDSKKGVGIKGSDYCTLPLCRECHTERHSQGVISFWEGKYFINVNRRIIDYLSEYILTGKGG